MYGKTAKQATQFFAVLCSILILFTLFPAFPVSAVEEQYTIYPGVSGIGAPKNPENENLGWRGDYVYFGEYNESPIKFRVLNPVETDFGGETMLLDCDTVLLTDRPFGESSRKKYWKDSLVNTELNTDFLKDSFSEIEMKVVANSIKEDVSEASESSLTRQFAPLTGEKVFILDYSEVVYGQYGYSETVGAKGSNCWLRSCGSNYTVTYMKDVGGFDQKIPNQKIGVSPALNLSRSSILFSSAADAEKPEFRSAAASSDIDKWKLTVLDGNTFPFVTMDGKPISENEELSVTAGQSMTLYHPDLSGEYNHVTAALTDELGNILYYGAAETDSTLASSVVPVPKDLPAGSYRLSVYAEKWNGAYHTDYATEPMTFRLKVTVPCTEHQYVKQNTEPAICVTDGKKTYTCTVCGNVKTEVIAAFGHIFGEWEIKTAAGCLIDGEESRICTACEKIETRAIKKTGHTPGEPELVGATCTEPGKKIVRCTACGEIIETTEISTLGHNWGQDWTTDENNHWHTCIRCGEIADKSAHWGGTATETEQAICADCGKSYGDLASHVHELAHWDAKTRTCMESGNVECWYCSRCKKFFADSLGEKKIPSDQIMQMAPYQQHSWKDGWVTDGESHWHVCEHCSAITDKAAHSGGTATETERAICEVCGEPYGDFLQHTHDIEHIGAKTPTCLEEGNAEYWYCSGCGQYFSDAEGDTEIRLTDILVPALGHDWSEWCYDAESHWQVCSCCGKKTAVSAHTGTWVRDTEPTEAKLGSQHFTCTDCGYTQTEEIPVLGHTHVLTQVSAKIPTCTESGNCAYFICACGKLFHDAEGSVETTLAETVLHPLGHAFSDWTVAQLNNTLEKRVCVRCSATEYQDAPAIEQVVPENSTDENEPIKFSETDEKTVISVKTGWKKIGKNTTYYQNGEKATGWKEVDGKTYFFDEKGRQQTEWVQIDGKWFYLNPDTGERASGWQKVGGSWYYLDADTGAMSENVTRQIEGEAYYFYDWGGMASNFWYAEEETGQWYFFRGNGALAKSSWTLWKGKWYYSGADGAMLIDTVTPDGYYVDENGVWIP